MPKETNLELKVGAFVLIAIGCLTVAILSVGNFSFFEKGKKLDVIFGFANGLKKAAPVRLAGVEAGLVKSIDILTEGNEMKVKVELLIDDGIAIPADSNISINQLGLLGEKYVEVTPGKSQQMIQQGGRVLGVDPVPVDRITQRIDSMTAQLEKTMHGINNGILTQENTRSLSEILSGVKNIVNEIQQGKGTLGMFLYNPNIYKNLDELSSDLKTNPWKLLYRPKSGKK
jgi:phospholipid/cholesterol/gamma-HCH transport system substrate-binding protein